MKNLLDLSRQRKEAERASNPGANKREPPQLIHHVEQDSQEIEEEEEDFEPSESEIIQYAEFLGIDPYREKYLLHIAKEGLITPVPPPWEAIEKGNQIIYINRQTGEKTLQHPLDDLFRELVVQQRKKLKPTPTVSSQGVFVAPLKPQPQQVITDPLLQLEYERKRKRNEEDARMKFAEKKKEMEERYKKQEDEVRQEYQEKQNKLREDHRREEEQIRERNRSKASQRQKQDQVKINRELDEFRESMKKELQVTLQQRLKLQKESLTLTYNSKKEEIRRGLEQEYKRKKREAESDYQNRVKQIEGKEEEIKKQIQELEKRLNKELEAAKEEIIEKSLDDHKHKIEEHRMREEKRMAEQSKRLEEEHRERLNKLTSSDGSDRVNFDSIFSLEGFIKELERSEENKIKGLKYEMDAYRSLRKSEIENELLDLEQVLENDGKGKLEGLKKSSQQRIQNQVAKLEKQLRVKTTQLEKTANNDYLKSLEEFQRVYDKEEGVLVGHHKNVKMMKSGEVTEDQLTLRRLEGEHQEVHKEYLHLRKQLERLKLEYETARQQLESEESEKGAVIKLLSEDQRRMYDRIMDLNNRITNDRRELELKELI